MIGNHSFINFGGDELPAYRQKMAAKRDRAKELLTGLNGKTVDVRTNMIPGFLPDDAEGIVEFTYKASFGEFETIPDTMYDDNFYSIMMFCDVEGEEKLACGFHLNTRTSLGFYDGWMYYTYGGEFIMIREHVG